MDQPQKSNIHNFMKALIDFEAHGVMSDFNHIFGNDCGEDLWSKFFNQCNSNTTTFYRILDDEQQKRFEAYLLKASASIVS